ncbi:PREDICTED: fatty acid synthase-like [Polistes dominula]|uniref:Fatty acid synthase-like n=1 Tax=Polistes dominula TaxID=743375 RepID=A0ABM1I3N3_POLDO|nr:PREDICTED: fatty acid synthase-like [Polistes dominula]
MVVENLSDDVIVISGISGKFPNSNNVDELMENLINGVDCVSENHRRWPNKYKEIPYRMGTMKDITKLDNIFFGISSRVAATTDPVTRLLTTAIFEAIIDAGLNPAELHNTKIAVFASLSYQESDKGIFYEKYEPYGLGIVGSARTMTANRISFTLDLIGPSCTVQSECVGSATALQKAFEVIKSGECEAAIVDAGILNLYPNFSYHLKELGLASSDGINRSFDAKASGFSRSESIGVLFLQKAKNARRIYAEISAINVEYGGSIDDHTMILNSAQFQAQIMKKTLKDCNLRPSDITYIEADGIAVKKIDREELKAIDLVYGQDRSPSNPLLIGSVKSNIGHTSSGNTINSIIKVILAMEKDIIPPNLHYDEPPEDAKCLQDGRVKVVTKPTHWTEGYAAVNTASFNGLFSHIILKRHSKNKKKGKLSTQDFPRLLTSSARNKEMLTLIFNSLKTNNSNEELLQLINDAMIKPLNHSLFRGYILLSSTEETESKTILEEIVPVNETSKELWFVFTGMGCQWTGMGQSLMKIPIFAEAIKICDKVLKPRGYDIVHIICDNDPTIYDNIVNSFLGIAAIQIGLVDVLYAVGVKPNYIIGHSAGELGCSYADGCCTREETILTALFRGLASVETEMIIGAMAAVGIGYQEIKHFLPKDIDVACHNGPQSSTISGPIESIKAFIKELQSKGIFAKIVPTGNISYHSRYIHPAALKLADYLKKVILQPKQRSERWISTSFPRNKWHSLKACYSSSEYFTNNFISPVLFEEVLQMIPKNSITLEISPHGLLQTILAQSLNSNIINLSLTKRGHKDNTILLLSTLGKLYNLGIPITVGNLYPRVPYPVCKGTPSISSLMRWEHSIDWNVNYIIIPSTIYLRLVQDLYLDQREKESDNFLIFEDIVIHDLLLKIPKNDKLSLTIIVMKGSGKFEVLINEKTIVATGTICFTKNEILTKEDFYTSLLIRGYKYGEFYKSVNGLSLTSLSGQIKWKKNWIPALEGLYQVLIFRTNNKHMLMPNRIQKIVIDMKQLEEELTDKNDITGNYFLVLPMKYEPQIKSIACTGIEVSGIELKEVFIKDTNIELLADEVRFISNVNETEMNTIDVFHAVLGVISENINKSATERMVIIKETGYDHNNIFECLENLSKMTKFNFELKCIDRTHLEKILDENFTLMIIEYYLFKDIRHIITNISRESFLLTVIKMEDEDNAIAMIKSVGLFVLLKIKITSGHTVLLLKKEEDLKRAVVVKNQQNCIDQLKTCLRQSKYDNVIFLVNSTVENNIFEILQDLKQEPEYKKLRIFDLQDAKAPIFSLENKFYENQIKLNFRQNVLSANSVWGTYRWMPLTEKSKFSSHWKANFEKSGSITWMEELPLINEPNKSIVTVECAAFDLNVYEYSLQNDVSLESHISVVEYSGRDENGRRVMGLVDNFIISNEIIPDPELTWIIPDNLSFEDAATIPHAYFAAFCILHSNAFKFKRMETILVHFGASDVGQALINISLSYNFDVYTTYETEAEKQIIELIQPRLPQSQIINIKHYKTDILTITKRKGLDFVVASYSVLDDLDSCLDIVKDLQQMAMFYDCNKPTYYLLPLANFIKHISLYCYCLQDLFKLSPEKKRESADLMRAALQAGYVKPIISRKLYLQGTVEEKNKVVYERFGKVFIHPLKQIKSIHVPRLCFDKNKCYFIVEGLDIFGMQLMKWMIDEGVTKLFVVSKIASKEKEILYLQKLCERGQKIIIRVGVDLTKAPTMHKLLKEASSVGQLGAIFDFHRTSKEFVRSSLVTTSITQILDQESKKICPLLENFVIFSFYNENEPFSRFSIVENICEQRKALGQHGLFVLLPSLFESTQSERKPKKEFFVEMSHFLQRLRVLLKENSSIICVYHNILKEHTSIEDLKLQTNNEQKEKNKQEESELELFEKYIYTPSKSKALNI